MYVHAWRAHVLTGRWPPHTIPPQSLITIFSIVLAFLVGSLIYYFEMGEFKVGGTKRKNTWGFVTYICSRPNLDDPTPSTYPPTPLFVLFR